MVAPPSGTDDISRTGREENMLDNREFMAMLLEKATDRIDTDRSSNGKSEATVPAVAGPVNRTEVRQMMKDAVNELINKLDTRIAQV